ncbi:MAG: lysostaphin resistance A-like protein [Candidatus Loosdrechtia sp.]|uniref:CPBP family intramembrane glutamic endopeptidase n=1 Tax=Candidatus Loosdrechtia sp. TaxID=3101272 RepID=UPI003A6CCB68|nr:MAG: CPBP family intramembrane metalloprotease [Candidatus Jettenia sp. AMX2]
MPESRWSIKDAVKVFFAYMILMFIGMPLMIQIIQTVAGYDLHRAFGDRGMILFLSFFINTLICVYIFYLVMAEYRQSVDALGLSLVNAWENIRQGIKAYLITIPFILIAGYLVNLIASYYGAEPEIQEVVKWVLEEKSPFILISLVFFGIVIAPVIEEVLFRGFLQPALRNTFGSRYAILTTAFLFATVHMDLFAFLQIFILGILLGYVYEKTQTLIAPIVVHILHNSLTLIFLLYVRYFSNGKVPTF